ncbi:MAG: bile acid:sodium symporter family protein [Halopenitus sp.]
MRLTELVDDYLLVWILGSVALGLLYPPFGAVTRFSTVILAVMVGSTSLTLSVARFRAVDLPGLGVALLGHVAMPFLAFGVARALGLSPELTAGFVLLGAVTPELVTPTMTELAGGDTALASIVLVVIGVGSTAFLPLIVTVLLGGRIPVDSLAIVEQLLVAVVFPMLLAVWLRTRYGEPIASREEYYSTVSALMVIVIIGGVTAENAAIITSNLELVAFVGVGVVALNLTGYLLGWVVSVASEREGRIAVTLSVGMRDFAVAAALVVAAGFPPMASLPAVLFGIVEMVSSAALVRWFGS